MRSLHVRRRAFGLIAAFALVGSEMSAQRGRGTGPATSARAGAPADLTGQYVSLVTEDWRYRMVTAPKGDVASVPLNPAGRKLADSWDPAKDEATGELCKAYGAAGVMRMPGRIRISWADDDTLKTETDAGAQTRMLYFKEPASKGGDWQGVSQAAWMMGGGRGGVPGGGAGGEAAAPRPLGTLRVVTTRMRAGYLRRNGVPYSDTAVLTEYYDRITQPNGDVYLVVTQVVEDPMYLNQPFMTSSHFKKQNDQSGWQPTPCAVGKP